MLLCFRYLYVLHHVITFSKYHQANAANAEEKKDKEPTTTNIELKGPVTDRPLLPTVSLVSETPSLSTSVPQDEQQLAPQHSQADNEVSIFTPQVTS